MQKRGCMIQRIHNSTVQTDITTLTPGDITPGAREILRRCPWETIVSNAVDTHTDAEKPLVINKLPCLYRLLQATGGNLALVWFEETNPETLFEDSTYHVTAVTYWTPHQKCPDNVSQHHWSDEYSTPCSIIVRDKDSNDCDSGTSDITSSESYRYTTHELNPELVYGPPFENHESETPALVSMSDIQQSRIDVSETQLTGYQPLDADSIYLDDAREQSLLLNTREDVTCAVTECAERVIELCPWTQFVQRVISYMHAPVMNSYKPSPNTLRGLLRATGGQLVLLWYDVEGETINTIDRISHVTETSHGIEVITRNSRMVLTTASEEATSFPATIDDLVETIAGEKYAPVIAHISVLDKLKSEESPVNAHAFYIHTS